MEIIDKIDSLNNLIVNANKILILLPDNINRDGVAASLALYLTWTKMKKTVAVVCSRPAIIGWSHLVGVNKISPSFGNRNFIISLDYIEGSIDRVSYNIEGNKFNLVIEPREGAPLFDEKKVHFQQGGTTTDVIVTIAIPDLSSLGRYYTENQRVFQEKPIVTFDQYQTTQYGRINIGKPVCANSELVAYVIKQANWPVDNDIATNLYDGILFASRNFSSPATTADTFELTAWLMRQGARKRGVTTNEELPRTETVAAPTTEGQQPPPDWFKPKIFKGGSMI